MGIDNDHALHELAGESVRAGRLPACLPERILGGQGSGAACDLCARELRACEPELEIETAATRDGASRRLHLHVECFAAWDRTREAL